jgi:hypothetical protein
MQIESQEPSWFSRWRKDKAREVFMALDLRGPMGFFLYWINIAAVSIPGQVNFGKMHQN